MFDALAVIALFFVSHSKWVDRQPAGWFGDRLADWRSWLLGKGAGAGWFVCAAVPALVAGAVGALLGEGVLQLIYSFAVLVCCAALPAYLGNSGRVLDAVYRGDREQARDVVEAWGPGRKLDAGKARFAELSLSYCAARLHGDVLAVLFWFVLLGPGGAVLHAGIASARAAGADPVWPVAPVLDKPAGWVSVLLFGLTGNFGPAVAELAAANPERAAIAAGGMDGEKIDVEQVFQYRKMLERAALLGAAFAVLLLFLGLAR